MKLNPLTELQRNILLSALQDFSLSEANFRCFSGYTIDEIQEDFDYLLNQLFSGKGIKP